MTENKNGYITEPITSELVSTPMLTKREYFAGLAMQGLMSNSEFLKVIALSKKENKWDNTQALEFFMKFSIIHADELLKQLEQ